MVYLIHYSSGYQLLGVKVVRITVFNRVAYLFIQIPLCNQLFIARYFTYKQASTDSRLYFFQFGYWIFTILQKMNMSLIKSNAFPTNTLCSCVPGPGALDYPRSIMFN